MVLENFLVWEKQNKMHIWCQVFCELNRADILGVATGLQGIMDCPLDICLPEFNMTLVNLGDRELSIVTDSHGSLGRGIVASGHTGIGIVFQNSASEIALSLFH